MLYHFILYCLNQFPFMFVVGQVVADPRCSKSGVYWSWNGGPRQVILQRNVIIKT